MTDALAFIERFLTDEEIYWNRRYASPNEQEYLAAFHVLASYFGPDLKPLRRSLDVDSAWIAEYEDNARNVHKRKLFMIKEFDLEGRTIYQFYLSRPEKISLKNFFVSLFAEKKGNEFIFMSRYNWNSGIDDVEGIEDEMERWKWNGGEDMTNRGKLIEMTRYNEPKKEVQKAIFHRDH